MVQKLILKKGPKNGPKILPQKCPVVRAIFYSMAIFYDKRTFGLSDVYYHKNQQIH